MSKVGFLRISHWLAFVFDFVNTTDYCKQQVASVAPRLQQLTTPAVRRRSCSVYNSCGLTPSRTGDSSNVCTYFVFETRISPRAASGEDLNIWQQNERCQLPIIVFCNDYGSILLSFRDITMWQTPDGQTLASIAYLPVNPLNGRGNYIAGAPPRPPPRCT